MLNNGIFLKDTNYNASSNLDSYHLQNMLKYSKPMDMGPIDIWAMSQKVEMPLYQFASFGGKNVKMVENIKGEYTWETPVVADLPTIIEDVEPSNITKGIDGTLFKILLNKRFGHTDIITYDKYNGLELYVTSEATLPFGNGYLHTVRLINQNSATYLDNKYLNCGTKFFRVGSAKGEYGETYSDITVEAGFRKYYNFVDNPDANVSYSISSRAALALKGGLNADGTIPVTEIFRNFDMENSDPSIVDINGYMKKMGKEYTQNALSNGKINWSYVTKLEAAHMAKIAKDLENYLMWGKGGIIRDNGQVDGMRLSVGLWKQLDSSFKHVYNKSGFTMDIFRSEIYNFFNGRVEFKGPDPKRNIVVQTGMGGMRMINEAILKEAINTGLVIQAASDAGIGAIRNQGMDLDFGFAFTSYVIPFLANVKFVINPAFDNVQTNNIENPIIDGFPLSSYSFIVFDVTDNVNNNIFLLKLSWDNAFKWFYQNGTMDYMGRTQGFQSSGNFSGYKVYMGQRMPAVWVADPTKVLKIVMRNPITGFSL